MLVKVFKKEPGLLGVFKEESVRKFKIGKETYYVWVAVDGDEVELEELYTVENKWL